jgi:hypothetical protein
VYVRACACACIRVLDWEMEQRRVDDAREMREGRHHIAGTSVSHPCPSIRLSTNPCIALHCWHCLQSMVKLAPVQPFFTGLHFEVAGYANVGRGGLNLADLEHKIIRAYGDARIHAAINCASAGCPRLRQVCTVHCTAVCCSDTGVVSWLRILADRTWERFQLFRGARCQSPANVHLESFAARVYLADSVPRCDSGRGPGRVRSFSLVSSGCREWTPSPRALAMLLPAARKRATRMFRVLY